MQNLCTSLFVNEGYILEHSQKSVEPSVLYKKYIYEMLIYSESFDNEIVWLIFVYGNFEILTIQRNAIIN